MIEISHLVKKYGDNYALDNISFTVQKGEIVGFLGPNGAGKTTTLNILTGYLSATSGNAKIDGIDILENPMEAKKHIGFLPEHPPLYLDMTVKEYLKFVFELKKCKLNRTKHLAEICDVLKIDDVYNRPISHLSKGYRQRVGIAQALIGNPDILIVDEPTVGLDPKQIIEIRNLITGLGRKHTIILSSHILSEVQSVCDKIVIINKGRIIADAKKEQLEVLTGARKLIAKITGDKKEVISLINSIYGVTYSECLEETDGDALSYLIETQSDVDIRKMLFTKISQKGLFMVGLEPEGANLEDVFISLVNKNEPYKPPKLEEFVETENGEEQGEKEETEEKEEQNEGGNA
jgi:ABC-2 type transport system ATP-binding protein